MSNIRPEFDVHILNPNGIKAARNIAEAFSQCLERIDALLPGNSREKSIVVMKLQEACFFAKKGIAVRPDNQVGELPENPS